MSKPETLLVPLRDDVYQSNPLVQSSKTFDTMAMRIFYLGLRGINPHLSAKDKHYDEDFPLTFIPNAQLMEIFGNKWYLSELRETCRKMFHNDVIELTRGKDWVLMHLFDRLEYKSDEGLYIQFDSKMRPFLLDLLDTTYTKIDWESVFKLSSPYAMRLLELMLQYQNIPFPNNVIIRRVTVENLRFWLNVPPDAYQGRLNNFCKKVLDSPISEINRKTNYKMKYVTCKVGRKISYFEISLQKKNNEAVATDTVTEVVDENAVEEKVESIEKAFETKTLDIESDEARYDLSVQVDVAQRAFGFMRKNADSCGLKLEDFRAGEIPINVAHVLPLREMYHKRPGAVANILRTVYGLTLERFAELYKP